jgi:hypothetical protein
MIISILKMRKFRHRVKMTCMVSLSDVGSQYFDPTNLVAENILLT